MKRIHRSIIAGGTLLSMAILYLAFTDNVDKRELVASVIAGAISAAAAVIVARSGQVHYAFHLRDVLRGWRMVKYVFSDTVKIMQGLAKQLFTKDGAPSFIGAVRFDLGHKDEPKDAGRRALAITYTTATPNSVVFGFVDQQGLLLYHQIIPGKVPTMTQELGARP